MAEWRSPRSPSPPATIAVDVEAMRRQLDDTTLPPAAALPIFATGVGAPQPQEAGHGRVERQRGGELITSESLFFQ